MSHKSNKPWHPQMDKVSSHPQFKPEGSLPLSKTKEIKPPKSPAPPELRQLASPPRSPSNSATNSTALKTLKKRQAKQREESIKIPPTPIPSEKPPGPDIARLLQLVGDKYTQNMTDLKRY